MMYNRRHFIKNTALGSVAFPFTGAVGGNTPAPTAREKFPEIRIGICADLHQDIMHDAPQRLESFINDMNDQKPDLIVQLGDFCTPKESNNVILDIWNRFPGSKYHVLGNHDMDGNFTRDQTVAYWNAIAKYYSFDNNGYHFVILDGNEPNPNRPSRGYPRFISDEQLHWLEADLDQTTLPVIVFCHQGLDNDIAGIENATKTRLVLERANSKAGLRKVQMVFSGHHHQDYHNIINGIHYIQINSISYYWIGETYAHIRYSEEVDKAHTAIKYTVPYEKPIWALVEISARGKMKIYGKRSVFVGPSPEELGGGIAVYAGGYPAHSFISDREIQLTMKSVDV